MTRDDALRSIASLLAQQAREHEEAAADLPLLRENTQAGKAKLLEVAQALGIEPEYNAACAIYEVSPAPKVSGMGHPNCRLHGR